MTAQTIEPQAAPQDIVARAARYYRVTRYIMSVILFGYGLWFVHDGFFSWPAENAAALASGVDPDKVPHNHMSVLINQGCGIVMPPLGIAILAWTLYRSRGEFRLSGDVLRAPGHPPIPLDRIRELDKSKWDRKGIAVLQYGLLDPPTSGKVVLDDFIYERDPTDAIYKRIEQSMTAPVAPKAGGPTSTLKSEQAPAPAATKPAPPKMRLPPRPNVR